MAESVVTTEFTVRYHETDKMGIVHHANYLHWFEVGRVEFMRSSGFPYRPLEEAGVYLPVTEATCKYHASALFDDQVQVRTRIASYNKLRLLFGYEVTRVSDGVKLVSGTTEHVFQKAETGQVIRLHKNYPDLHAIILEKAGLQS
jgi:acyl-CoA thioester hydrolase